MANFCTNCGAPVSGAFCTGCGASVQAAPAAVPPAAPQATVAPAAASGGSAVKIVLIVVGVFVLLGAMSLGGLVYAGYRAKKKFAELRREYTAGTTETTRTGASREPLRTFPPAKGNGCRALEGQEAAGILGAAVDRAESTPSGRDGSEECSYWVSAAERQRLLRAEIAAGVDAVGKADKDSTAGFEKLIGGALGAVIEGAGDNKNDEPAFQLQVWRTNGRAMWDKMESAKTNASAVAGNAIGMATSNVEGVGDRALVVAGGHSIMVLKGDSFFLLGFRQFVPGREKTAALARVVAQRL